MRAERPKPTQRDTGDALCAQARAIFRAGLEAVDPRAAVLRSTALEQQDLLILDEEGQEVHRLDLGRFRRVLVIGAGKAAGAMAQGLEERLGARVTGGFVVVKDDHEAPTQRVSCRAAGHPIPDDAGARAAEDLLALVEQADADTLLLAVFSGGASALLPAPPAGVSLADERALTTLLLGSGLAIQAVNTVRRHVSRLRGGQLARAAAPATLISLVLSDVIGDDMTAIASGPTVADPTSFADAVEILAAGGLLDRMPASLRHHLEAGQRGQLPENPRLGDPLFGKQRTFIIGNNGRALRACAKAAAEAGFTPLLLTTRLEGEAREVARVLVSLAREVRASGRPIAAPACLLCGGETTVTLRGAGRGGRNQELALAAALALEGLQDVVLLSGGTDGTDGPTDAAGAVASGQTVARARALGLDARQHLEQNDAYPYFSALGDLLLTGPTGTNVMDIQVLLVGRHEARS